MPDLDDIEFSGKDIVADGRKLLDALKGFRMIHGPAACEAMATQLDHLDRYRTALRDLVARITLDEVPSFSPHNEADLAALRRAQAILAESN